MLFRLALALGKTVSELRATLSNAEFQEWCLYFQIEPFGESRADLRNGIVAATIQNVYSAWVGGEQTARPADFMPYIDKPEPTQPVEDDRVLTDDELAAWADAAIYGIPPEGND